MTARKNHLLLGLALLSAISLAACKKEPGFGGLATVKGKVYVKDYDKSGYLKSEGYGGDLRVTIGVAGEAAALDDQRTQYDGAYEFRFLRKGRYQVWVYENCDTCLMGQKVVVQEVNITEKKQTIVLPDFVIAQ